MTDLTSFGDQLRQWRARRRMSQMDLALEAEISTRHLSFVETGRSKPSREMVLMLADGLAVPPRERNLLLVAAGFAPHYAERPLDDPALTAAKAAIETLLAAHEPFPALAVDRHWTVLAANRGILRLFGEDALNHGPLNALRAGLDPQGLGKDIVNYGEWRGHILERLRQQIAVTGDPLLADLHEELAAYPEPPHQHDGAASRDFAGILVPFRLASPAGVLSFLSTTTVFGTPLDVTLSEIAIETFFPADPATAAILRQMADAETGGPA